MHSAVRVLVLYESRRGFTLQVARAIRDAIRLREHAASTAPLRSVDPGTLAAADAFVIGTWVKGLILVGVGPATGAVEGIRQLPDLAGRPVALYCTCDVSPRHTIRTMAELVSERHGRVTVGAVFKRKKIRELDVFVDRLLEEAAAALVGGRSGS
jgi:hypothetical protein